MKEERFEAGTPDVDLVLAKFKVGDVVRLRGSGPAMTIEGVKESGVRCVWFDKGQALHRDVFPIEALIAGP